MQFKLPGSKDYNLWSFSSLSGNKVVHNQVQWIYECWRHRFIKVICSPLPLMGLYDWILPEMYKVSYWVTGEVLFGFRSNVTNSLVEEMTNSFFLFFKVSKILTFRRMLLKVNASIYFSSFPDQKFKSFFFFF